MSDIHPSIVAAVKTATAARTRTRMGEAKLLPKTRRTLEVLLGFAIQQEPISYEHVSEAIEMHTPRWANVAFGALGQLRRTLSQDPAFPYRDIPDITTIVSHKNKQTAGSGALTDDPKARGKDKRAKLELLLAERSKALQWPHWRELAAFIDITPFEALAPPRHELVEFERNSGYSAGKSAEHQLLQDQILKNPKSVCIDLAGEVIRNASACEYLFWSLDRLDVIVKTTEEWVGFEVKPTSATHDELRKGIYQAVKYAALLRADLLDRGELKSCRCFLVSQGVLSPDLRRLADLLGVPFRDLYQVEQG